MTNTNGPKNSILPDVDGREAAVCRITDEPAVTNGTAQFGSKWPTRHLLPSNTQTPLLSASYEINEANRQFIGSALLYCSNFPGAEVVRGSGLVAACRNTPVPISNAIFLSRPVIDEADLQRRARTLAEYLRFKQKPPMLLLCREWVPQALRQAADDRIRAAGLVATTVMSGMAADELLPESSGRVTLEWRRVADEATRRDFADTNSAAYGFPPEAERLALGVPQIWNGRVLSGYVGYLGTSPAVVAGAMALHGAVHIVCVATRPEYQRRGFAEAAIRHLLDRVRRRTGLQRTTLSATEAGAPLYARMGYHATATFLVYTRKK